MGYYENDDRPGLRFEMNNKVRKDMNRTFGLSNLTEYIDKNGRRVCLGDWICFLWWVPRADGTQREIYIYGRILRRHGKLIFKYRDSSLLNGPRFHERRLDALNFDSQLDWEIVDETQCGYGDYMPAEI